MERIPNEFEEGDYYCKKCGQENEGEISFSELTFGTANIVAVGNDNEYDEFDEYETHDSDDFTINGASCGNCSAKADTIGDLFTNDVKEVWKLRYGMEYPDRHKKMVRRCKCLICEGLREGKKKRRKGGKHEQKLWQECFNMVH